MSVVLDASAVLAMIFGEAGGKSVLTSSRGALLSAVNVDEVLHKVARRGIDPAAIEEQLLRLGLLVTPFDIDHARASAALYARLRGTDTSFADRACLSLAMLTGRPVVTADAKWMELGLNLDIRLIR